jgi:hypothetical protein
MPVATPSGASLGQVEQIVANGRGEVQQVVVRQGDISRTLPANMLSANGNALIAGEASGGASGGTVSPVPTQAAPAADGVSS